MEPINQSESTDATSACRAELTEASKIATVLPPHVKVIVLGSSLLAACVGVAVVGMWGVRSIQRNALQLTQREAPGLALLLNIDRDLYQGQLGLERAAQLDDPERREMGLRFFAENVDESAARFGQYKELAGDDRLETSFQASYSKTRVKWLQASNRLTTAIADELAAQNAAEKISAHASTELPAQQVDIQPLLQTEQDSFEEMRALLSHLVNQIYQPKLDRSGDRNQREVQLTLWKLLTSMGGALITGLILIISTVRMLRKQKTAADAMDVERERQNRRQTFESRLSRGLGMTQDESGTLRMLEHVLAEAAPGLRSELLLADSSRAHLHQVAATDASHAGCSVSKPSDCPAVRRGHRLSFETGAVFDACPHLKNRAGGNCSAVCVPLSIMGQTVGVLHATGPEYRLPSEEQTAVLDQIASKAGERLGMLRAFSQSEAQALIDPLTGLMNRRCLEARVHELTRQKVNFAVAFGDLDHFKKLNDTHGHETGDKALRIFAQTLKASVRPGDLAARWGGEEFVLVLPNASASAAQIPLDRVRAALARTLPGANAPTFTVSFGVAESIEGSLFVDVLARADEALLQAKRQGRNRTIAADVDASSTATTTTENAETAGQQPLPAAA